MYIVTHGNLTLRSALETSSGGMVYYMHMQLVAMCEDCNQQQLS